MRQVVPALRLIGLARTETVAHCWPSPRSARSSTGERDLRDAPRPRRGRKAPRSVFATTLHGVGAFQVWGTILRIADMRGFGPRIRDWWWPIILGASRGPRTPAPAGERSPLDSGVAAATQRQGPVACSRELMRRAPAPGPARPKTG
jgi:hypothetical protein